jgi:hypothetical protein
MKTQETKPAHVQIPVEIARQIAIRYAKSMVVILAYDPESQLTHTTTYGVEPIDKERAADVGERCAQLICGDGFERRTSYEDYRFTDQGKRAQQIERLIAAAKAAKHAFASVVAYREGITDEMLEALMATLDEAIAEN